MYITKNFYSSQTTIMKAYIPMRMMHGLMLEKKSGKGTINQNEHRN